MYGLYGGSENIMKITAAARVNVGVVRKNNEDNLYFNGRILDESTREAPFNGNFSAEGDAFSFTVCDGMGGEAAGEEASYEGVRCFKEWYETRRDEETLPVTTVEWTKDITAYCSEASRGVYGISQKVGNFSGCTFVNITLSKDSLMFANIGDSRLYAYVDKRLIKLSEDHTYAELRVRSGEITAEEARVSPDRNKLIKYIGADPDVKPCEPHAGQIISLRNNDRFLLCSDGLTDMLTDEEIAAVLAANKDDSAAADILLSKALENGGHDNCTIILVTVKNCSGAGKGSRAFAAIPIQRSGFPNRWQWISLLAAILCIVIIAFCMYESGTAGV